MPSQTLAELTNIRAQAARLHKRLLRLNARKLPVYWSVQPAVFSTLARLEQLLQEDQQHLSACLSTPKK